MNQEVYDSIRTAAFQDELQKIAGEFGEAVGTGLAGLGTAGGLGAALGGIAARSPELVAAGLTTAGIAATPFLIGRYGVGARTKKGYEREKDRFRLTNLLFPSQAGSYRMGRRLATEAKGYRPTTLPTQKR